MENNKQGKTLSRIGRKPSAVPDGVEVEVQYGGVKVTGPRGTLEQKFHPEVIVKIADGFVVGYGMDFAQRFRNLPHVAVLAQDGGSTALPAGRLSCR